MYYVYRIKYNTIFQLLGSYEDIEKAKNKAKEVKGLIRQGGYDGQTIYDYRS